MQSRGFLNGKHELFAPADLINLNEQGNVKILKWSYQLSEEPTDTSVIKQRTTQWESERKKEKVTGSSVYQAIGCDSLKHQKQHFDKVMYNIEPPDFSEEQKIAMKHGQESEIHQIATLSSMIMPFLFPDQVFLKRDFMFKIIWLYLQMVVSSLLIKRLPITLLITHNCQSIVVFHFSYHSYSE